MAEPRTFLCVGKDCRRDKGHKDLVVALDATTWRFEEVRCQDICKGPVAGVEVDGRVEWFRRLRKRRHRRAIVGLVRGEEPEIPAALQDRWVHKRSGKVKR